MYLIHSSQLWKISVDLLEAIWTTTTSNRSRKVHSMGCRYCRTCTCATGEPSETSLMVARLVDSRETRYLDRSMGYLCRYLSNYVVCGILCSARPAPPSATPSSVRRPIRPRHPGGRYDSFGACQMAPWIFAFRLATKLLWAIVPSGNDW